MKSLLTIVNRDHTKGKRFAFVLLLSFLLVPAIRPSASDMKNEGIPFFSAT